MDSFLRGREHIANSIEDGVPEVPEKIEQSVDILKPEQGELMSNAQVQTVYEGDVLKKIIIHCDCGKELVIGFDYKN